MEKENKDKAGKIKDKKEMVKIRIPINFLSHTGHIEYITDQRGLEHFKTMLDPNKDQREYDQAIAMENLTFIDGVLITWKLYDKILKKHLTDENGDPEKGKQDGKSYEYLGIINDDINDLLFDQVLRHGYFKNRGYQLIYQFGINI